MTTRLLFIHALSALHAGTGQGVGVIDLPIARETATGLPYLPGSSIKGTLRDSDHISEADKQVIFGPPTDYAGDNAGSAQFADARLLLMPVRSLAGTFAWVTSPYVVRRFLRDSTGSTSGALSAVDDWDAAADGREQCKVATGTKLKLSGATVVLEDLDLEAREDAQVTALAEQLGTWLFPGEHEAQVYWRGALKERLCIVRDDVLNFLMVTATEVIARVRLQDDTKTVAEGALWYEEALPCESVLYGLVVATPVARSRYRQRNGDTWAAEATEVTYSASTIFERLIPALATALQFGGKATVGRGICRAVLVEGQ